MLSPGFAGFRMSGICQKKAGIPLCRGGHGVTMRAMADPLKKPAQAGDLEIKDAQLIFNRVWQGLEDGLGRENLRFPRELILLGGAPGAGKGTNTRFIMELRDITAPPLVVSQLLTSPDAEKIKARGAMVGDREVVDILFRKLLEPEYANGAVLDGFPRTKVQVECLKMLYDQMVALRREFAGTPFDRHFRQPVFHIMVLFVDENESVARQLKRGREVIAHNEEVKRAGMGRLMEERPTDFNESLARNRYRVFKEQTYDALVSLKEIFHYHFINAQEPLEVVHENIVRELHYQSSLELDPRTFDRLRALPVANEIVKHARQDLVRRLDQYEIEQRDLFARVVEFIDKRMMPIIIRHAISGHAIINTEDPLFNNSDALAMLIDIFSERDYHATTDVQLIEVPESIDLQTGKIHCHQKRVFRFQIRFRGSRIRRG